MNLERTAIRVSHLHTTDLVPAVQRVWFWLPADARRVITRGDTRKLRIQVVETFPCRHRDIPETFGCCGEQGTLINLWAPFVRLAPLAALEGLLAHELAHAYLAGLGRGDWWSDEDTVRELVATWGFDPEAACTWWAGEGRAKVMR